MLGTPSSNLEDTPLSSSGTIEPRVAWNVHWDTVNLLRIHLKGGREVILKNVFQQKAILLGLGALMVYFFTGCAFPWRETLTNYSFSYSIQSYSIKEREDGGYDLNSIEIRRRYTLPLPTGEGIFPTQGLLGQVELKGKGIEKKGKEGYGTYYDVKDITVKQHVKMDKDGIEGMKGYAYIDKKRRHIIIRLAYLVDWGNGVCVIKSEYTGMYRLDANLDQTEN
ncbi:MAG: hypothetical protein LBV12_13200 [Puniceicoccales bacterium]|jgi:hypothetical protein|nr:hypothetical protein [Puniceicoccales bacterium]